MKDSKIFSYLGFAKRAKKLVLGFGSVELAKKQNAHLLLLCSAASENACKLAKKFQARLNCPMLILKDELLEDYVSKAECKIALVQDKNLALAILKCAEDRFILYTGGND